jgi:hypothetical protein
MEKSLIELIKEYGVENIYFLINMKPIRTVFGLISYTTSSDPDIPMLCRIDESRYKISDNYKITLRSVEQIKGLVGSQHFYISDLQSMIRFGNVSVFIKAFN